MPIGAPRARDALLALAGAAVLSADGLHRGLAPVAAILALSLLACAPLAWSARAPLIAMLAVTTGLIVCLAVFHPYDGAILVASIALYNVALLGDRRRSLLVGAAWAVLLVGLIAIIAPHAADADTAVHFLVAFVALALGDTVRSRRALQEARRERKQRLERERERESERRITHERLRIARDLHDTVAHALVAINVRAGVAAHLNPAADADGTLTDIEAVSAEALADLRSTLSLLRDVDDPAPTSPATSLTAIDALLDRAQAAGLTTTADVRLNGHAIPSAIEQAGFRIVQEALTNVMRHAAASRVTVAIRVDGDTLRIEVADDGANASPPDEHNAGHGLRGMTERAVALGGDVTAGPAERGGWQVRARIPLTTGARS
jgi:signal transduction histidine kinase